MASMAIDQVKLLTARVPLPVKPMTRVQLGVIVEEICEAWRQLVADWPTLAGEDIEGEVNGALVVRLLVALRGRTPFSSLVSGVTRGSEQYNYDGRRIEKRPDVNFQLRRRDAAFPLAAECKIIDAAKSQTVGRYDKNGISRFVTGDYAWFNAQGIMIAYVRDATDIERALTKVTGSAPTRWPSLRGPHFETSHDRGFAYVDRTPEEGAPGAISLVHVWLGGAPQAVVDAFEA